MPKPAPLAGYLRKVISPEGPWPNESGRQFGQGTSALHVDRKARLFPWTRLWGRRVSASVEGRLAAADLYETDNEVVVKADLPGVPKDNVEVTLTDSTLTLRGEKKEEVGISHEAYHFRERSFGTFNRTIDLPVNVRSDQATATITNGVLEVRVPKTEPAKRKELKVQVQ